MTIFWSAFYNYTCIYDQELPILLWIIPECWSILKNFLLCISQTLIPFECPVWPFSSDPGVEQLPVLQHLVLLSLYNNTSSFMLLVQGIEIFDKNIKICIFQLFRKKENSAIIGVLFFFAIFYFMKIVLTFHWTCMCMYYIYFGCNNIKILKNQNSHKKELKIFKFWHKPSMRKVKGI